MTEQLSVKTNFTSGQLSGNLFGRGDLRIYENGAKTLENVIINPTGGVSRRKGLRCVSELGKNTRLLSFEFNTEQAYLLCLSEYNLDVYKLGVKIASLTTPWSFEQLKQINWTQSADTLLIVHPDVPPQQISRNTAETWTISTWEFYSKDGHKFCPYYNFYQNKVTLTASATSGNVTLTANSDIFNNNNYLNIRVKLNKGEVLINGVSSPRTCTGVVTKALSATTADAYWEEEVFSALRGYPRSVTFHQDRMVIGGSKSLPNRLWLSKSSDLFNFDIGTGLDDEAIDFAILSDQVNAITNVVSTRHLLVFTTGAEWMVSGEPLTPSSIMLNRQTNIGSYQKYSLLPQNLDGATAFISQNGRQLREFLYTDVEQAYQARDLTLLSADIINKPVDMIYFQDDSILYLVLEDGTVSCLTSYRTEEVNAWSRMKTTGKFMSISVVSDEVYFVVQRGNKYYLETFAEDYYLDCGQKLASEIPQKTWSLSETLNGEKLMVVADGFTSGIFEVKDGEIELLEEAKEIIVGQPYQHVIEPLPYMCDSARPYPPKAYRIVQASFRIMDAKSLKLDIGSGYFEVPLKKMFRDQILDSPPLAYSGDVELRSVGWVRSLNKPMWSIKSEVPCAFTLLSVVNQIKTKD